MLVRVRPGARSDTSLAFRGVGEQTGDLPSSSTTMSAGDAKNVVSPAARRQPGRPGDLAGSRPPKTALIAPPVEVGRENRCAPRRSARREGPAVPEGEDIERPQHHQASVTTPPDAGTARPRGRDPRIDVLSMRMPARGSSRCSRLPAEGSPWRLASRQARPRGDDRIWRDRPCLHAPGQVTQQARGQTPAKARTAAPVSRAPYRVSGPREHRPSLSHPAGSPRPQAVLPSSSFAASSAAACASSPPAGVGPVEEHQRRRRRRNPQHAFGMLAEQITARLEADRQWRPGGAPEGRRRRRTPPPEQPFDGGLRLRGGVAERTRPCHDARPSAATVGQIVTHVSPSEPSTPGRASGQPEVGTPQPIVLASCG